MKNLKTIGLVLMSAGFLGGSFALVMYPDRLAVVPYIIAFVVTAVGATLLRVAQAKSSGETEKVATDIETIKTSLTTLVSRVQALNADDRSGDKLFDVCTRIDAECMDPINEFVDAREAMSTRFGLAKYAEMMDSFALGERALNRAWCASADGYIDEVNLCLERAERHLGKALGVVEGCFEQKEEGYRKAQTSKVKPA